MSGRAFIAMTAVAVVCLCGAARPAFAGWVWTPESGRWINPRNQPKESAALQFQHAEELLNKGEYEEAIAEFKKIHTHFPASSYGDLAQFSIGRAHEAAGEWDLAAEAYQQTIDRYPGTRLFDRVVMKQYELGNKYYERAVKGDEEQRRMPNWREIFGSKSDLDKAIGVYQRVVDNQPFTESAAEAQYRIGLCHMKQEEFEEAIQSYEKVLDLYPGSPWAGEAAFSVARAHFEQALPAVYDQTAVEQAKESLHFYLRNYDNGTHEEQVTHMLDVLENRRAEHEYRIAEWYHNNYKFSAARLYYAEVVKRHPDTEWATRSQEQLARLP